MMQAIKPFGFRPLTWGLLLIALALPARAQRSMFSDFKSYQKGEILTIILAERTAAQRESNWNNKATSKAGGSASVSGGSTLSGTFGVDAKFNKEATSENGSTQSDLLSGTITVRIVSTDDSGNLRVEGERRLQVNGETHIMKVAGLVRPYDVDPNNTVFSYKLANAEIEYRRAGGIKNSFMKPGRVVRLGVLAVLGGAIAYALQ